MPYLGRIVSKYGEILQGEIEYLKKNIQIFKKKIFNKIHGIYGFQLDIKENTAYRGRITSKYGVILKVKKTSLEDIY